MIDAPNASELLRLINETEDFLKGLLPRTEGTPGFTALVRRAADQHPHVKPFIDELCSFNNLRNAIVHSYRGRQTVIAEPCGSTIERFRLIYTYLSKPRLAREVMTKNPAVLDRDDALGVALELMAAGCFSQVLIGTPESLVLLTAEHISAWLSANVEHDLVSLSETKISDVLPSDAADGLLLLDMNATAASAEALFSTALTSGIPRVYAVVVTNSGRRKEKPLGIITPWDLLGFAAGSV